MATEHLLQLFRHNRWANALLMEACLDLSEEQLAAEVHGTYGVLGPTLAHLTAGEASYVWRFDQTPGRFQWEDDDPVPPITELASVLDVSGARLVDLAATTPDDHVLVYPVDDEERRWPAWVVLGQAIDHGREHRTHAATVLTQLGITPPDMDMWTYGEAVQGS